MAARKQRRDLYELVEVHDVRERFNISLDKLLDSADNVAMRGR